jgi:drug/metabolite transporter (DMT)-like permease
VLVSNLLAIAASFSLALSGMFISELSGRVDVFRFARWNMIAAFTMTGAGSIAFSGWRTVAGWEFGLLAASSFVGIIIASTTYFAGIYAVGPRIISLLYSLTSPFALGLGYLVLGETITARQGAGIAVVFVGIVLAIGPARDRPSAATAKSARVRWFGIACGVVTALGQAGGTLLARPAMAAGVEPFTGMAIRAGVAAIFYVLLTSLPLAAVRKPYRFSRREFGIAIAAAFFGTGLGSSLVLAALAGGNVGIVSTLSSMMPIAILPLVWARSGKAPSPWAWAGALLAVTGTALISVK